MKQIFSKCNYIYSTITKKLKTYHNNEKNNKMKPKQRKKTHLFSWEERSSTETILKNLKAFSRNTLQNSYQYLYVLPTDQEVQKILKA